jgi:two-component system cell cycle sensor histidine kinase/response regulator CckA
MHRTEFGRGRRAIVVDDEGTLANLAGRILEMAGFLVVTLSSSAEAALLFRTTSAPVHLLVTDSRMPEMGGPQLIDVARTRFAAMPVVLMSGTYEDDPAHAHLPANVIMLQKPFTPEELLRHSLMAIMAVTPTSRV